MEEQAPFGKSEYDLPSYLEKVQSQLPARQFWATWREEDLAPTIQKLIHQPLDQETIDKLLSRPFSDVRKDFLTVLEKGRKIYEQERAIYTLCRPERLLELAYKFILYDGDIKKIARYQQWYRKRAREVLGRYLEKCYTVASRHGVPKPLLVIRTMQRRWESCSYKGRMTLNVNLIKVPVHYIEYVIMHELCHLKYNNHSKKILFTVNPMPAGLA